MVECVLPYLLHVVALVPENLDHLLEEGLVLHQVKYVILFEVLLPRVEIFSFKEVQDVLLSAHMHELTKVSHLLLANFARVNDLNFIAATASCDNALHRDT